MIPKRSGLEVELLENRLTPSASPVDASLLLAVTPEGSYWVILSGPSSPSADSSAAAPAPGLTLVFESGGEVTTPTPVDSTAPGTPLPLAGPIWTGQLEFTPVDSTAPGTPTPPAGWYALTAEVPVYLSPGSGSSGTSAAAAPPTDTGPLITVCKITKAIEFILPCDPVQLSTMATDATAFVADVSCEGDSAGATLSTGGIPLTPNGGAQDVDFALPIGNYNCTVSVYPAAPAASAPPVDGKAVAVELLYLQSLPTDDSTSASAAPPTDSAGTVSVAPTVASTTAILGSASAGTVVVLTGTGFTGASSVSFGSTPAAAFVVLSDTTAIALAPPGATGTADVTVTNEVGTSGAATNPLP